MLGDKRVSLLSIYIYISGVRVFMCLFVPYDL